MAAKPETIEKEVATAIRKVPMPIPYPNAPVGTLKKSARDCTRILKRRLDEGKISEDRCDREIRKIRKELAKIVQLAGKGGAARASKATASAGDEAGTSGGIISSLQARIEWYRDWFKRLK